MDISKRIYIHPKIKNPKITLWKLKRNKNVKNIYCIIFTKNNFLEIVNSHFLKNEKYKGTIIGISKTKKEAINMIEKMFQDIYIPNPSTQFMREYFTNKS